MVLASISIIPSSPSLPSSSTSDSPSISSPTRTRPFFCSSSKQRLVAGFSRRRRRRTPPLSSSISSTFRVCSQVIHEDNGSSEQLLNNNSFADFLRFKRGADGGSGELQTSVVSYKKKFPWSLLRPFLQVDLVSTIHIADEEYFQALQKELESYDCVLYEMVASRETLENIRNPTAMKRLKSSRSRGFNIVGYIQRQLAHILMLDLQLDCLSYQAANWYHADLDYETFKLLQLEKGESFFSFIKDTTLRTIKAILQPASIPEDLDPLRSKLLWAFRVLPKPLVGLIIGGVNYHEIEALSRLDFGAAMKVFLAKRLTSEFTQVMALVDEKSVIIGERNRVAVETLRAAIDEGHNRIAILYGGGHMPDLGRRLGEEFDLVPSNVQWITAWSIRKGNLKPSSSFPFLKTMAKASGWPLNRYQTLALLIFSSVLAVDLWIWELFFGSAVNWVTEFGSELLQYIDNSQLI